jgi:hypothetical protein
MLLTPLYAVALVALFLVLSFRTIRQRRQARVAVGDGGADPLTRAIRAHGNFAEYAPLALLMLFFFETGGAPPLLVHLLGIALLAGRLTHAWGISQPNENFRLRVAGMSLTFTALAGAGLGVLLQALAT